MLRSYVEIVVLIALVVVGVHGRDPGEQFEPVDDICERCVCVVRNETDQQPSQRTTFSLLDCSTKNLQHMLASLPTSFPSSKEHKIVFALSGNNIIHLQQLPLTDAGLVFACRHCNLTTLASGAFLDTPNIIRLDLSWNRLTGDALRPDVFRGKYSDSEYESIALDGLDLSYNAIDGLERDLFEHMMYLRRLSLARNPLKELNGDTAIAIGSISKLEHLDLSHTGLSELPDNLFQNIGNLHELLIEGNQFHTVPAAIRLVKPTLVALYIGENPMQLLNEDSFFDLDHLTHLNISRMTQLETIERGTFSGLKSLEMLAASHNPLIEEFDLSDLASLIRLRTLDISHCGLQRLHLDEEQIGPHDDHTDDIAHIAVFPKLRSVKLDGNPWHCDCELYETLETIKHVLHDEFQSAESSSEVRCETPYDLAALPVTELSDKSLCSSPPKKVPKIPIYETPAFLRPRSLMLSILSVGFVLLVGFIIGFVIVCIKRKLKENDFGFTSPVRYTTVRNSTTSTIVPA